MTFFKNVLASCLGVVLAFGVLIIGFIIFAVAASGDKEVVVSENSVLQLKLNAPISEIEADDPLADLFPGAAEQRIGLIHLKQAIKQAAEDTKISGIYLNVSQLMGGIASIDEIRQSLLEFRKTGKWIVAYSDSYTEGAYYLASVADKVYLNPEGDLEFNGLASDIQFFKRMFDKLEIKPEVFRVGEFKSAVEPFLREDMSDPNRLQLNSMINSIYGELLGKVAETRRIPRERLKEISDKMLVRNASQALKYGLVDSLYYEDQVKEEIRSRLGLAEAKKINMVKYSSYKKLVNFSSKSKNEIAVIVADGSIMPGESDRDVVGGTTMVDAIQRARKSERVKAIVIRINSPGGAFSASDQMWRAVSMAAKEKPVIASMSNYAASGGYYLAMACDTIVAQPTTITGSIGIFSVMFDLSGFLGNKIGITSEEVKTGEIGELFTVMRPLSDVEKDIWQKRTEEIYETFTSKAAQGRRMTQEQIKKIASGRVWTGAQGKDNGLVDILGGFDDAIEVAAKAAKIEGDYKLLFYPRQKSFIEKFTGNAENSARVYLLKEQLGENYSWYEQWQKVKQYQGVQARMPWEVNLH